MGGPRPHETARAVIRRERDALDQLAAGLGEVFDRTVEAILERVDAGGRLIVCGMGKSGQIGRKISSTLVSTGVHSRFLHPAEGFHGDVGMVTSNDVVVVISNSGNTQEVLDLLPLLEDLGAMIVAFTGAPHSPLGRAARFTLSWGDLEEADPLALVPTTSTAATLALGDALTVALMHERMARGLFDPESYRLFHPSGAIGRKLRTRVIDLLRGPHTNPVVPTTATFAEALEEVTRKTLGGVSVVDEEGRIVGILTDGDIRRCLQGSRGSPDLLLERPVSELMTRAPTTIRPEARAVEALAAMENHKPRPIFLLPVADAEGRAVGMIHLHTLVQAGLAQDREGE